MTARPPLHSLTFDRTRRLTPADLAAATEPVQLTLSEETRARVSRCEGFVREQNAAGTPIYGMTTGFGPLVAFGAAPSPVEQGYGLLNHLRSGQGDYLAPGVARAMLLARVWSLAQGHSGVSLPVIDDLCAALATPFAPAVPEWGSVGASGDLTPLAHAAGALRGEGEAFWGEERVQAAVALERAGLRRLVLQGRDALGLVNGTSLTAAAAGLAVHSARRAVSLALNLTGLLAESLGAADTFTSPELLEASGHRSAHDVAVRLRERMRGATVKDGRPLQEAYSLRCVPQLVGAVEESLRHVEQVVESDLNGVSDNPLFFPEQGKVIHGGNFFGQQVAFAADALNLALTQLANLAERQLDMLLDPGRNGGLPLLLSARPGAQSGLAGVNLAATAIVASMRRYATPASIQTLPTNGHNQDVVPFGTQAAMEALRQSERLRLVQASLALGLRQAAYLGARPPSSTAGAALLALLCETVTPVDPDRPLSEDVRRMAAALSLRG
ncbi:aromatic amino acid lyase [Corallococcus sp. H22C18031201]|uniref:HAL/PAL/TAL family ammonia-lyase n=1 Tax=Citreicoccus inhibens TaxID=2849499 RepID=UPI000E73B95F|nr:aromatic amino acid ammonia-lyase [Citreicoccus inhibens]MBU8895215.1 aromatic amino acid ammonia-lyase [Citreicoccus inhibens]RJS27348.1 aromatic amino acid lyase [Corallococcus sp. H22C18031201]